MILTIGIPARLYGDPTNAGLPRRGDLVSEGAEHPETLRTARMVRFVYSLIFKRNGTQQLALRAARWYADRRQYKHREHRRAVVRHGLSSE
jgi:hypothetical protein